MRKDTGKRSDFVQEEIEGEKEETQPEIVEGDVTIIEKFDNKHLIKPKIVAMDNGTDYAKLMLKELRAKENMDLATVLQVKDLKQLAKLLIKEEDNDNFYNVCYLPFTNTDLGRDYSKLEREIADFRRQVTVPVLTYFDGHDEKIVQDECKNL